MTHARPLSAAVLGFSLCLLGCDSGNPNSSARVSGSLTYNGQPIKGAVMQFHSSGGTVFEAQVSPDGTYQAPDIGTGEMIITVDTESLSPAKTAAAPAGAEADMRRKASMGGQRPPADRGGGEAAPPPASLYVKIPAKYASAKTSPLTVVVKSGRQVHNVDLTD